MVAAPSSPRQIARAAGRSRLVVALTTLILAAILLMLTTGQTRSNPRAE
jgi:hypothetical protein